MYWHEQDACALRGFCHKQGVIEFCFRDHRVAQAVVRFGKRRHSAGQPAFVYQVNRAAAPASPGQERAQCAVLAGKACKEVELR